LAHFERSRVAGRAPFSDYDRLLRSLRAARACARSTIFDGQRRLAHHARLSAETAKSRMITSGALEKKALNSTRRLVLSSSVSNCLQCILLSSRLAPYFAASLATTSASFFEHGSLFGRGRFRVLWTPLLDRPADHLQSLPAPLRRDRYEAKLLADDLRVAMNRLGSSVEKAFLADRLREITKSEN
jgi:hypothetical protein